MGSTPEEKRVHERLLAGIPTAPAEAVELLLPRIVVNLQRWLASHVGDHEAVEGAAIGALLSYVQQPKVYNPQAGGLGSFLAMAAKRDYLNWVRTENRHRRRRVTLEVVENMEKRGKYTGMSARSEGLEERLDLSSLANKCAQVLEAELPSAVDRAILKLMLEGERRTKAYADAMGLPPDDPETTATVKRAKDRISKKLQRMRGRFVAG